MTGVIITCFGCENVESMNLYKIHGVMHLELKGI